MKKIKIVDLLIFIMATELVGVLSRFVSGNSSEFYNELVKPPLSPSGWIFPVVWIILYALMGVSAYIAYYSDISERKSNMKIYIAQLLFNFLWSVVFFRFRLLGISVIVILILLFLIIKMILTFAKSNKAAAYINIPYLVWTLFATYLNIGVFILN